MGRKAIADADEKILLATIAVGGSSKANVLLSTKAIAQMAGVSEFTVFSRYKNKEQLIYHALGYAVGKRTETLKSFLDQGLSFAEATKELERYLIEHPELTLFLINYGECVSKIGGSPERFEAFLGACRKDMHLFDPYYVFPDEESQLIAYVSYIRNVLYDAQFVLSGFATFDEAYQNLCADMICFGLGKEAHDAALH
jgi:AcrR family transcriptional regulator